MIPKLASQWDDTTEGAETYRGRAYHARLGAREASSAEISAVFERLAASYEALALEVERLEQMPDAGAYQSKTG